MHAPRARYMNTIAHVKCCGLACNHACMRARVHACMRALCAPVLTFDAVSLFPSKRTRPTPSPAAAPAPSPRLLSSFCQAQELQRKADAYQRLADASMQRLAEHEEAETERRSYVAAHDDSSSTLARAIESGEDRVDELRLVQELFEAALQSSPSSGQRRSHPGAPS